MSVIEVKNLSKSYEYYKKAPGLWASVVGLFRREKLWAEAVKSVNFKIGEGELVGFLGPNGAGKTTTLKMLSGILYPTDGEVKVLDYEPKKRQVEYQKQFALVMGQKNQLWWDLPAMESFLLNKEIYEVPEVEFKVNLEELTKVLEVGDILDIPVRKLSLGQRMKCELIAALLHKPKVLYLDEPTIGLDVVAQKNIRDFIKKYNQEKKTTIILTSHYMEDIVQLCRRVIVINEGVIVYDGELAELIRQYAPHKTLVVTFNNQGVKREEVEKFGEIVRFNPYECEFRVPREGSKDAAREILSSSLPVDDILINEVDADEIIRKIFRERSGNKQ